MEEGSVLFVLRKDTGGEASNANQPHDNTHRPDDRLIQPQQGNFFCSKFLTKIVKLLNISPFKFVFFSDGAYQRHYRSFKKEYMRTNPPNQQATAWVAPSTQSPVNAPAAPPNLAWWENIDDSSGSSQSVTSRHTLEQEPKRKQKRKPKREKKEEQHQLPITSHAVHD
uniref:Uncharacterized protein n=1 Tax=Globodera rostochiensis TaxID=31243 RepID=A0A914GSS9_GLORO